MRLAGSDRSADNARSAASPASAMINTHPHNHNTLVDSLVVLVSVCELDCELESDVDELKLSA